MYLIIFINEMECSILNSQTTGREFTEFIERITLVVEQMKPNFLDELENLLRKLVQTDSWLMIKNLVPDNNSYARYSLHHDSLNRFEVLALVWKNGQKTQLHDHDGTWGLEGVLSGQIKVHNFKQTKKIADNIFELQHTESITLGRGETDRIVPPADCHIIEVDKQDIAITIHVYGKKLECFKVFEHTGEHDIYTSKKHNIE